MSFSSTVKIELLGKKLSSCCEYAQGCAMLLFGREFSACRFSFSAENDALAAAYCGAVGLLSGKTVSPEKTLWGKYKILIENREITETAIKRIGADKDSFAPDDFFYTLQNGCCRTSFIRGAFLACGTVTNPEREYQLEFTLPSHISGEGLCAVFEDNALRPKMTERAGSHIVYFKNSSDIEDILTLLGAPESAMKFMSAKVVKDIRNIVNRRVNFENANLSRTIASASRQYEAIAYLKEKAGLDALPESLREIARLRYENRELSTAELARLLSEPLSVSGVNHRLQKLIKTAQELRK